MVDLRQQLRDAMERSGLTRKRIADETGLSYSMIHGLVEGTRDVRLDSASRIAKVLDLELRSAKGRKRRG